MWILFLCLQILLRIESSYKKETSETMTLKNIAVLLNPPLWALVAKNNYNILAFKIIIFLEIHSGVRIPQ